MSKELQKAANAASKALGMSVEVYALQSDPALVPRHPVQYLIELYLPPDDEYGGAPVEQRHPMKYAQARAFLDGLELGGRVQGTRFAAALAHMEDSNND